MDAFDFDFVLGSIHNLGHVDLYVADINKAELQLVLRRTYLEALYCLADEDMTVWPISIFTKLRLLQPQSRSDGLRR